MRRPALLWVLAACLCATALGAPQAAGARPLQTGIAGLNEESPISFQRIRGAGATYVRIAAEWIEIAPENPPSGFRADDPADPRYDWDRVDQGVVNAAAAGLTPVVMIEEAPLWAQRCRSTLGSNCDVDPEALAAFATAAARRYSGGFAGLPRVWYWQGLNEPNLSIYFNPQFEGDRAVSPDLYRVLANRFYDAVTTVDPSNIVLIAGLGPIAVPRYTIGPIRFTRDLLCMRGRDRFRPAPGDCGGGVKFDVFDIHPYTTGGPTHEGGANDVQLGDLAKMRALLDAADRAGRIKGKFRHTPLWVGEFSWDTNPPDPGGLPMQIATRWVAEALYRSWDAGVEAFFWFTLRDRRPQPQLPFSETLQAGLYFRGPTVEQDQPKEILHAYKFPFVSFRQRKGLLFWGRTPSSERGRVAIQVWKGNRWRGVGRARADRNGIFHGVVPTRYGKRRRGFVRAVYRGEAALPFSMRPVKDFFQPPFG